MIRERSARLAHVLLTAMMMMGIAMCPAVARAETVTLANGNTVQVNGDRISGTGAKVLWGRYGGRVKPAGFKNSTNYIGQVKMPDGQVLTSWCYDAYIGSPASHATPGPTSGSFSFHSVAKHGNTYTCVIESQNSHTSYMGYSYYYPKQRLMVRWTPSLTGKFTIVKSTTKTDINLVDKNPMYSLDGIRYGVYSDSKCTNLVKEVPLSKDGDAAAKATVELRPGTYWVKETATNGHYKKSDAVRQVSVVANGNKTSRQDVGGDVEYDYDRKSVIDYMSSSYVGKNDASADADASEGHELTELYKNGTKCEVSTFPVLVKDAKAGDRLSGMMAVKYDKAISKEEFEAAQGADDAGNVYSIQVFDVDDNGAVVSSGYRYYEVTDGYKAFNIVFNNDDDKTVSYHSTLKDSNGRLLDENSTYNDVRSPNPGWGDDDSDSFTWDATGYTIVNASVEAVGDTATFNDDAEQDAVEWNIQKLDTTTGSPVPEGDATLAGAVFKVSYYTNQNGSANASKAPTRTWYLMTDENGLTGLKLAQNNPAKYAKVPKGGTQSAFYTAPDGSATLPVGTVSVTEVSVPEGYLLSDANGNAKVTGSTYWGIVSDAGLNWGSSWKTNVVGIKASSQSRAQKEQVIRGGVEVQKVDLERNEARAQGDSKLEGAEYGIAVHTKSHIVLTSDTTADRQQHVYNDGDVIPASVSGLRTDAKGHAATNAHLLPYSNGSSYTLTETKASEGFFINKEFVRKFDITTNGQVHRYTVSDLASDHAWNTEQVFRSDIEIHKYDLETSCDRPLGEAQFVGAQFTLRNVSDASIDYGPSDVPRDQRHEVQPDGVIDVLTMHEVKDASGKVVDYVACTERNALPYGTYEITETKAPTGYRLNKKWKRIVEIREDEQKDPSGADRTQPLVYKLISTENDATGAGGHPSDNEKTDATTGVLDQLKRDDFHFTKRINSSASDQSVAWLVTSRTTGEQHVIVTDRNGTFDSERYNHATYDEETQTGDLDETPDLSKDPEDGWVRHYTNGNDSLLARNPDGSVAKKHNDLTGEDLPYITDSSKLDPKAGVWFGKYTNFDGTTGIADADNQLCSLPYDDYVVEEVMCANNENATIVGFEVHAHDDGFNYDLGTINDQIALGGIELWKGDSRLYRYGELQGNARVTDLEGATFKVYAADDILDGTESKVVLHKKYDYVDTLVAGDNGYYSSQSMNLPRGSYYVIETSGPKSGVYLQGMIDNDGSGVKPSADGMTVAPTADGRVPWQKKVTISTSQIKTQATTQDKPVPEEILRGGLKVGKVDLERFNDIDGDKGMSGQGDADLSGAVFSVYNVSEPQDDVSAGRVVTHYADADHICNTNYRVWHGGSKDSDRNIGFLIKYGIPSLTLTTKANGVAESDIDALPYGTYVVVETSAPKGYYPDSYQGEPAWNEFTIKKSEIVDRTYSVSEEVSTKSQDQIYRGGLSVQKVDSDKGRNEAQGDATLEGAKIRIVNSSKHAVAIYRDESGAIVAPETPHKSVELVQPGQLVTTLTTDKDGYVATPRKALPYGTYTLTEESPSTGYLNNDAWKDTVRIREDDEFVECKDVSGSSETARLGEDVIRGGVRVMKADVELAANAAQGDAKLSGAKFAIRNDSKLSVVTDGVEHEVGSDAYVIETDENGVAQTPADALPYGTYTIREVSAPAGYFLNDKWEKRFEIRENGVIVDLTSDTCDDQIYRGGFEAQKFDLETAGSLPIAEASFAQTEWTLSNASVNGNKVVVYVGQDGRLANPGDGTKTVVEPGADIVKLASDDAGHVSVPDHALPYGTYTLRETAAPKGYVVNADWRCSVEIREDGAIVRNAAEVKEGVNDQVIRADVRFDKALDGDKLLPGVAFLVTSKTTGERHVIVTDDNGVFDSSNRTNPNYNDQFLSEDGKAVDETKLDRTAGVWFSGVNGEPGTPTDLGAFPYDEYSVLELHGNTDRESMEAVNGGVDMRHWDFDVREHQKTVDEGKVDNTTIELHTTAVNGDADIAMVPQNSVATIVDTVSYHGLTPGDSYTVNGKLMDKNTGESVKDASGNEITAQGAFTAEAADGETKMEFTVDTHGLEGHSLVVFERLYDVNGYLISTHEEIDDDGQTVLVPDIHTTLTGDETQDHVAYAEEEVTLTDVVSYDHLRKGHEYVMSAKLMDRNTGEAVKDADGNDVVSSVTFTPEEESGTVSVQFKFNASGIAGHTTVAFEDLVYGETVYATHADITDEEQSVHFPDIHTTAHDEQTGRNEELASDGQKVVDVVAYENLLPGKAYHMSGIIHVRSFEGKDLGILMSDGTVADDKVEVERDEHGVPVDAARAEADFTPESPDGTVEMTFTVNTGFVAGSDIVVFETLRGGEHTLATHDDIDDQSQSVHVPWLSTTLHGTQDNMIGTGVSTVTDTVYYKNLIPGTEYSLRMTIHLQNTDGTDGGVLKNGKKDVTETVKFTPDLPDGQAEVSAAVDGGKLAGRTIVAFEQLYDMNGKLVGRHEDISDESQAVTVEKDFEDHHKPPTPPRDEKPELRTQAHGTQGNRIPASVTNVTDTVAYNNLTPGMRYDIEMTLHLQKEDGTDGGTVTDGSGKTARIRVSFTPKASEGKINLTTQVDATKLAGRTLVAFERLYDAQGKLAATHENINDKAQAVFVDKSMMKTPRKAAPHPAAPPKPSQNEEQTVPQRHVTGEASGRMPGLGAGPVGAAIVAASFELLMIGGYMMNGDKRNKRK